MASIAVSPTQEAFIELLTGCQSRVMGCIYALVHNMQDTEELYQQACLVMWQKFESFQPGTDFAKWACSVAYLEVMNFQRSRRGRSALFSPAFLEQFTAWESAEPGGEDDSRNHALRGCLERLADSDRQLLDQRYANDQPLAKIAQHLGRTPQSISNSLGRIRAALLECVRRKLATEGR